VTTAAAMFHSHDFPQSAKIVAVISGGNTEPQLFLDIMTGKI
jgi:threonine dehydratase